MTKPKFNPQGILYFVVENCIDCKYFEIHDDDIMLCNLESCVCKKELRIYEPSHVKYCKDCFYFRKFKDSHKCLIDDTEVGLFYKPCSKFKYVRKSYPRKSS